MKEEVKTYGHDVTVHPSQTGTKERVPEYRVFQGKFCVKILHDKDEADDYASKLAQRRDRKSCGSEE